MSRIESPLRERSLYLIRAATALGLTMLAACGSDNKVKTVTEIAAPPTTNASSLKPASDFEWANREVLTAGTYGSWDPQHAEPLVGSHLRGSHKYLLVVDDGRYNYPSDPNPNTDQPTGLYAEASQKSQPVTKVPDGTVLKVIGWTKSGQLVSDAHGGSGYPIWEEVVGHDGTIAYGPWVNLGYTAMSDLKQLPYIQGGT